MITMTDCIGLCSLSEAEVDAIAEHEHVPAIVALELGSWLCRNPSGEERISWMIEDDIECARCHGRTRHMHELEDVLVHYREAHPTVH